MVVGIVVEIVLSVVISTASARVRLVETGALGTAVAGEEASAVVGGVVGVVEVLVGVAVVPGGRCLLALATEERHVNFL